MADDVTITAKANATPPDGTVIATDDVSSVHYQKVKIALGADGAVDTLLDSGQQTMANSAPVALASDQSAVAVDATGQGDVPITLDSEVVAVDATGQGDVPITLDSEVVAVSAAALPLPSGAATAANQQAAATAVTIYNVTMTSADTEYSQALPANTKRFSLQCLTDFDIRFAFATGKVATPTAPYALVRAGMNYYADNLNLAAVTLYVASPDAGKVAEIIAWT